MRVDTTAAKEERICDICGEMIPLGQTYYKEGEYDCCSGKCVLKARVKIIKGGGKNTVNRLLKEGENE